MQIGVILEEVHALSEPHNKGGESLKEALEKLDFNIEFVKESIRKSDDKEEKAGLRKLLTDYEALKTKLEESAK
jgi:hypothetical protein